MRAFHENPNRIHTELTFINPYIVDLKIDENCCKQILASLP